MSFGTRSTLGCFQRFNFSFLKGNIYEYMEDCGFPFDFPLNHQNSGYPQKKMHPHIYELTKGWTFCSGRTTHCSNLKQVELMPYVPPKWTKKKCAQRKGVHVEQKHAQSSPKTAQGIILWFWQRFLLHLSNQPFELFDRNQDSRPVGQTLPE